jgi:hypothetical protein
LGAAFKRRGFHLLDLDAHGFHQLGEIRKLEQHADRADQRALAGDDMIGGDRRDVTARRGQPLDHHHQRLLGLQAHQRIIELLGAGRGAARRIDVDDDSGVVRLLQPLQRLDPLAGRCGSALRC